MCAPTLGNLSCFCSVRVNKKHSKMTYHTSEEAKNKRVGLIKCEHKDIREAITAEDLS